MKILILLNSIRVSGTEKLMFELSRKFSLMGDDVYLSPLITPFDLRFKESVEHDDSTFDILFPEFIERFDWLFWKFNGLTVFLFGWSVRSFILQNFISKKCKEIGIELIVSNSYPTDMFVIPVFQKTNIPYVIVDHGSYCYFLEEDTPFSKRALDYASAIVGVSKWTVGKLKQILPNRKITLIYNGYIELSRGNDFTFRKALETTDYFVFCMHGRGSKQKGWDLAIEAFKIVKSKGYKIKLLLLTEGSYINELKTKYDNEENLIFGGFVYNLADVFEFVDVGLVLSRKYEAFGLSVLDYFGEGIPVIGSNLGGLNEVVHCEGQVGGLLVNLDNNGTPVLKEIVDKMVELMNEEGVYNDLSAGAKRISEYYSIKKCSEAYSKLFQSIHN
ncbi:MAG TPA: glycosyltransferase family 4 protein [Cyclobacteriaceae bacterium]|nr:glycosyltransferase family 4 protein [Cyclobacteriaceae bacterium]